MNTFYIGQPVIGKCSESVGVVTNLKPGYVCVTRWVKEANVSPVPVERFEVESEPDYDAWNDDQQQRHEASLDEQETDAETQQYIDEHGDYPM
jgi:heat shock protein HspQ